MHLCFYLQCLECIYIEISIIRKLCNVDHHVTCTTLSDRKYEECRVQVRGNLVLNLVIVSSDHELIMSTKSNIYDCCHEKRALTITFSEIHIFCQFGLANCS